MTVNRLLVTKCFLVPSTSSIHSSLTGFKSFSSSSKEYSKKTAMLASDASASSTMFTSGNGQQNFEISSTNEHSPISGGNVSVHEQNGQESEHSDTHIDTTKIGDNQQEKTFEQQTEQPVLHDQNEHIHEASTMQQMRVEGEPVSVNQHTLISSDTTNGGPGFMTDTNINQDVDATFTLKMDPTGLYKPLEYEEMVSENIMKDVLNGITGIHHGELFGHAAELLKQTNGESIFQGATADNQSIVDDVSMTVVYGLTNDGLCISGGLTAGIDKKAVEKMTVSKMPYKTSAENEFNAQTTLLDDDIRQESEVISGLTVDQNKILAGLSSISTTLLSAFEEEQNIVLAGLTDDGSEIITGITSNFKPDKKIRSLKTSQETVIPIIGGLTNENIDIIIGYAHLLSPEQNEQTASIIANLTLDNEVVLSGLCYIQKASGQLQNQNVYNDEVNATIDNSLINANETILDGNTVMESVPPNDQEMMLIRRDSF